MARADILNILYSKEKSPLEFKFDSLWAPPILSLLPVFVIEKLRKIATSIKLSSDINAKYTLVKETLKPYGFVEYHRGTNRVVYKHYELTNIVLKVAIDSVGMSDNPKEFKNQMYLKPFVTKTFDVSPCGTVAISERVEPITSVAEFASIADDIFELLVENIIGEYILEDIGTKYPRNWGIRRGFGPVLLDYPYMFKLDGNKLFCNKEDPLTGTFCDGLIDYDNGFNNLICTKCGKLHLAKDLQQKINENKIILKGDDSNMKAFLVKGDKIVSGNEISETKTFHKNRVNSRREEKVHSAQVVASLVTTGYNENIRVTNNNRKERKYNNKERFKQEYTNNSNEMEGITEAINKYPKKGEDKKAEEPVVKETEVKEEKVTKEQIDELQKKLSGFGITEEEMNVDNIKYEHQIEQNNKEVSDEEPTSLEDKYVNDEEHETFQKIKKNKRDALSQF